jgi:hypothetical protein
LEFQKIKIRYPCSPLLAPHSHNSHPLVQYKDTHVITYTPLNTLQYHVLLAPPYDKQSHIEKLAIQILCIHHKTTTIGDISAMQQLNDYFPNTPSSSKLHNPLHHIPRYRYIKHGIHYRIPHLYYTPLTTQTRSQTTPLPFLLNSYQNTATTPMVHLNPLNKYQQITGDPKLPHMEFMALLKIYKYRNTFLGFKTF